METNRADPEFIIIVVIPNNIFLIHCHIKRNSTKVLLNNRCYLSLMNKRCTEMMFEI